MAREGDGPTDFSDLTADVAAAGLEAATLEVLSGRAVVGADGGACEFDLDGAALLAGL